MSRITIRQAKKQSSPGSGHHNWIVTERSHGALRLGDGRWVGGIRHREWVVTTWNAAHDLAADILDGGPIGAVWVVSMHQRWTRGDQQ